MPAATRFSGAITSEAELREVVGVPLPRAADKGIDHIDEYYGEFIRKSPFLVIGSSDANGNQDVSPKGDPPGFVHILDEKTLVIPDRPGNRRADTLVNILANPKVALYFMVPGSSETLRVQGRATIVLDEELRESLAVKGKTPHLAIVVEVEEAFLHCARCIMRSDLWATESWLPSEDIPSLTAALIRQKNLPVPVEQAKELTESLRERLY